MRKPARLFCVALAAAVGPAAFADADFTFFGRSGDGILLDFSAQPGVGADASFTNLDLSTFGSHVGLTSDTLENQPFADTGRLHVFAAPNLPRGRGGDRGLEPGFQGTIAGSVQIDGQTKTFEVQVQPGYSGVGRGAVTHNGERLGRRNNALSVAQQQHRLAYFGYQAEGGPLPSVTGSFDGDTNQALRTFQAAIVGGLNTTQASVDGIVGDNTGAWLNAGNAPFWERLSPNANISSVSSFEPYATSWTVELVQAATADAKAATGINQRITALSTFDGYGSSAIHNTHRAGMDIDLGIPLESRNTGNGFLNSGEATAAEFARAFIDAHLNHDLDVRVSRILNSNVDIIGAVNATHPGVFANDTSGGHASHFHIDVTPLGRDAPLGDLLGDFDLTDAVDEDDIDWLFLNQGGDASIYSLDGDDAVTLDDVDVLVEDVLGTIYGDANLDRFIDQADLNAVLLNWGRTDRGWATGDFNGDRFVDQADLNRVLNQWGAAAAPDLTGLPVPEPAAALTLALLGLTARRRQGSRAR